MDFSSTNATVLAKPVMVPITQGVIYEDTGNKVSPSLCLLTASLSCLSQPDLYLQLPCLMPGTVEYLAVTNFSAVMDGVLYFQSYRAFIYRDCTPANTSTDTS